MRIDFSIPPFWTEIFGWVSDYLWENVLETLLILKIMSLNKNMSRNECLAMNIMLYI